MEDIYFLFNLNIYLCGTFIVTRNNCCFSWMQLLVTLRLIQGGKTGLLVFILLIDQCNPWPFKIINKRIHFLFHHKTRILCIKCFSFDFLVLFCFPFLINIFKFILLTTTVSPSSSLPVPSLCLFVCFCYSSRGFSVWLRLSWNSLAL